MQNKLTKKAYVSIEIIVVAAVCIVGGLSGVLAFVKNGQDNQKKTVCAASTALGEPCEEEITIVEPVSNVSKTQYLKKSVGGVMVTFYDYKYTLNDFQGVNNVRVYCSLFNIKKYMDDTGADFYAASNHDLITGLIKSNSSYISSVQANAEPNGTYTLRPSQSFYESVYNQYGLISIVDYVMYDVTENGVTTTKYYVIP